MKFLAGIVLFNPEINRLKKNVDSIINQVSELILIDNGSSNLSEIDLLLHQYRNVKLINNNENLGIARGLNQIMEIAESNGFEWCLLLDQDSVSPKNIISKFEEFINNTNDKRQIGIVSPYIVDINQVQTQIPGIPFQIVDDVITSGSLNSVNVWRKIGKFDEQMFIDGVDHEYCFRLGKAGYKIYQLNDIILMHEIGKRITRRLFFWKIESLNHSAFRKYYIARNIIYFDKKHFGKVSYLTYLRLIKQTLLVLTIENNKKIKIISLIKGIRDGINIRI